MPIKIPAQRVVSTKNYIYSYQGHLHVDINHVEVLFDIADGEASRLIGFKHFLLFLLV